MVHRDPHPLPPPLPPPPSQLLSPYNPTMESRIWDGVRRENQLYHLNRQCRFSRGNLEQLAWHSLLGRSGGGAGAGGHVPPLVEIPFRPLPWDLTDAETYQRVDTRGVDPVKYFQCCALILQQAEAVLVEEDSQPGRLPLSDTWARALGKYKKEASYGWRKTVTTLPTTEFVTALKLFAGCYSSDNVKGATCEQQDRGRTNGGEAAFCVDSESSDSFVSDDDDDDDDDGSEGGGGGGRGGIMYGFSSSTPMGGQGRTKSFSTGKANKKNKKSAKISTSLVGEESDGVTRDSSKRRLIFGGEKRVEQDGKRAEGGRQLF